MVMDSEEMHGWIDIHDLPFMIFLVSRKVGCEITIRFEEDGAPYFRLTDVARVAELEAEYAPVREFCERIIGAAKELDFAVTIAEIGTRPEPPAADRLRGA